MRASLSPDAPKPRICIADAAEDFSRFSQLREKFMPIVKQENYF